MSAVPQGAFAAVKVKQILQSQQSEFSQEGEHEKYKFRKQFLLKGAVLDQSPLIYSSKLMNSIWGLYNQYSVHNLKKNKESGNFSFLTINVCEG